MNKITLARVSLILSLMAGTHAVADGLSVVGSWWSPDEGDASYGAGIQARIGDDLLYLEAAGTYFEDITQEFTLISYELSVIPLDLGLGLKLEASPTVDLYAGGGATYFVMDSNVGDSDDRVGYYVKGGCEVELNENVGIFLEALWRDAEARVDEDEGLVENRFNLEGVALSVGLVFLW